MNRLTFVERYRAGKLPSFVPDSAVLEAQAPINRLPKTQQAKIIEEEKRKKERDRERQNLKQSNNSDLRRDRDRYRDRDDRRDRRNRDRHHNRDDRSDRRARSPSIEKEREKPRKIVAEVIAEDTIEDEEEPEEEELIEEMQQTNIEIGKFSLLRFQPTNLDEEKKRLQEIARQKVREKIALDVIVATGSKSEEKDEEDEESHDQRRERLRQLAKQKMLEQQQEEMPIVEEEEEVRREEKKEAEEEEEEEEGEDESEYEEEEEEFPSKPMIAPVFKRKEERDTITEQLRLQEQEELLEKERLKKLEERKQETKQILQEEIKRNIEEKNKPEKPDEEDLPDESDDENDPEEYEKWKLRELARIKKEREEKEKIAREKAEIERRRNLTDEQIAQEDKDKLKPKEKPKWNFMQKYYNAGAFYRTFDEEDLAKRWNFNQPTLEDKVDKTILPSVMQVKNFGKSGRTKYTHLVDQDTTNWDSPWAQKDSNLLQKYKRKMGGTGSVFPANKKRKV